MRRSSLQQVVAAALGIGLLILLGVVALATRRMSQLVATSDAVDRTHRRLRLLERAYSGVSEAEANSRGYALTGDPRYLALYESAQHAIPGSLQELRTLSLRGPGQGPARGARFDALERLVARRFAAMETTVALAHDGGLAAALTYVRRGPGRALGDSVRATIDALEREEEALLERRSRSERASVRAAVQTMGLGVVVTLLVGLLAAVGTRHELAARASIERALRDAKDAAEAASRAKSDFLARMSHELRTPLNSVIGFSNVLLRRHAGALGADGLQYLERVRDNGLRLLVMIDDLLDIARIEVGRLQLAPEVVSLEHLVREVVGSFEEEARARGLALTVALPPAIAPVETDPARLRQVLANLLSNALKFTTHGAVTVRVATEADTARPTRIAVEDTGIGIPRDRQAAVFEAFEQADTGTARRYGGTGLGLAISRALCDLLGYRLELASEPGVGSTFSVVLAPDGDLGRGAA